MYSLQDSFLFVLICLAPSSYRKSLNFIPLFLILSCLVYSSLFFSVLVLSVFVSACDPGAMLGTGLGIATVALIGDSYVHTFAAFSTLQLSVSVHSSAFPCLSFPCFALLCFLLTFVVLRCLALSCLVLSCCICLLSTAPYCTVSRYQEEMKCKHYAPTGVRESRNIPSDLFAFLTSKLQTSQRYLTLSQLIPPLFLP